MCLRRRGPRVHRRHAADRRHRPHRSAERRSRGAATTACSTGCCSWTRRSRSIRRTSTRGAATRRSAQEIATNPRLQKRDRAAFVEMMRGLNLSMPTHLTEALRTNMSGGKTVAQMLAEAAAIVPFMSLAELQGARRGAAMRTDRARRARARRLRRRPHPGRATAAARPARAARQPGAARSRRARIVTCCEFGRISTLAAATLRRWASSAPSRSMAA